SLRPLEEWAAAPMRLKRLAASSPRRRRRTFFGPTLAVKSIFMGGETTETTRLSGPDPSCTRGCSVLPRRDLPWTAAAAAAGASPGWAEDSLGFPGVR